MTETRKKQWSQPQLKVLGDVESLTLGKNKSFGGNDGFMFQGQGISG